MSELVVYGIIKEQGICTKERFGFGSLPNTKESNMPELINELVEDYEAYCHKRLIEEFGEYDPSLYGPIHLYQRFKHRIIDSIPRTIFKAKDLDIPERYQEAYQSITQKIVAGDNLRPYQSRKLKTLDFNDDMLSQWQVQHLHLGKTVNNDGYIERTKELLYVFFTSQSAYFIAVGDHGSFCELDIMKKLYRNWPELLEPFRLAEGDHGNLPTTKEEVAAWRRINTNIPLKIGPNKNDVFYPPGMGCMVNGSSSRSFMNSQQLIYRFEVMFEEVKQSIDDLIIAHPELASLEKATIGLEVDHNNKQLVYVVKETGFKFT